MPYLLIEEVCHIVVVMKFHFGLIKRTLEIQTRCGTYYFLSINHSKISIFYSTTHGSTNIGYRLFQRRKLNCNGFY